MIEPTFSDVLHVYTGEMGLRETRLSYGLKVDDVQGDVVTFLNLDRSRSGLPFFVTMTVDEINSLVDNDEARYSFVDAHYSSFAPRGECITCDRQREAESTFFPSHQVSSRCQSGQRPHCTCPICWG